METTIALILLLILAATVYATERAVSSGWSARKTRRNSIKTGFPGVLAKDSHWQRTTAVVERSIMRATDVAAHHASAARQLDAAEYALHCLLDELGGIMKITVGSPLGARPASEAVRVRLQTALAA
jgi:hypothetical protein